MNSISQINERTRFIKKLLPFQYVDPYLGPMKYPLTEKRPSKATMKTYLAFAQLSIFCSASALSAFLEDRSIIILYPKHLGRRSFSRHYVPGPPARLDQDPTRCRTARILFGQINRYSPITNLTETSINSLQAGPTNWRAISPYLILGKR